MVGAFRFICTPAHLAYDDPIVYPGQPGRSHLHQFFGNTAVNANSTFQSLRTTGASTCMSPLNRSGYWQPAMLTAEGKVVRPDYWQIYYKRRPKTDAACTTDARGCVGIPRGMRFIFGYDMITNTPATGNLSYLCIRLGRILVGVEANTIAAAAAQCQPGDQLEVRIGAPECWDGRRIDSPNHRDHVAYEYYEAGTGRLRCPDSHPYLMPTFTLSAFWSVGGRRPGRDLAAVLGRDAAGRSGRIDLPRRLLLGMGRRCRADVARQLHRQAPELLRRRSRQRQAAQTRRRLLMDRAAKTRRSAK